MSNPVTSVDNERADESLVDQTLAQASDETLQRVWREGIESGASEVDFSALKAEALCTL